jgi:hypothetical protein
VWWVGAAVRFVVIPMIGMAAVAWWLIGDVSEAGGRDVMVELALLQDHPGSVGAIGVLILAVVVADLLSTRPVSLRSYCLAVLPFVVVGGLGLAFAGRVVTARVGGANIGGGLAMVVAPVLVIGLSAGAIATLVALRPRASVP